MKTGLIALLALIAFAANSVLCRLALGDDTIDATSFTSIRLAAGAATLWLLVTLTGSKAKPHVPTKISGASMLAPLCLFVYAASFSFAYLELDTASGALILFGTVQLYMMIAAIAQGDRPALFEWLGIAIAFSGLLVLMLPSAQQPSIGGSVLMILAGIAWGIYTLLGRGSENPLQDTASNFIKTMPLAIALLLVSWPLLSFKLEQQGIVLAVVSGSLASGLGYAIWYRALTKLSVTQAAVSQLSVPIIAALGGVILVGEVANRQLIIAMAMTLGGIALVLFTRRRLSQQKAPE